MALDDVDITMTIENLVPAANYGRSATYQELQDTWRDQRRIPTEQQIQNAWDSTVKEEVRLNDVDDKRLIEYPPQKQMVLALMAKERGDSVPLQRIITQMDAVDAANPRLSP